MALLMPTLIMLWVIGITFLVMNVFESLLVSKLAIVKSHPIVDSMSDLTNNENVKGITERAIELQEVLKDSGIPLYEKLWMKLEENMVDEDIFTDEYLAKVEKGEVVIVHGRIVLKTILSNYFPKYGRCNFHLSQNQFFPFPLVIALRKSLPISFRRKFNEGLTRLIAGDIPGKWLKPILQKSRLCTSYTDNYAKNDLEPLQLKNIIGVIVIWGFGILSSFICLFIEICVKKYANKNKN